MPLDGNDNAITALPLITPHAYHPNAPATGIALARSLHGAYNYARAHGRTIGYQTYRTTHLTSITNPLSVVSTSLAAIAEFRVVLPSWANYVVATCWFNLLEPGAQATVEHRVDLTDGGTPDTGTVASMTVEEVHDERLNLGGYTGFDYNQAHAAIANVRRVNATGATCTMTVLARAIRAHDSAATPYRPHLIVGAYETLG